MTAEFEVEKALKRADENAIHVVMYAIQFNFAVRKWNCNLSRLSRKYCPNIGDVMQWGAVSPATPTLR